jgi:hypothetical protein
MRSRFFPSLSEENLLNRIDLVLKETGGLLDLNMDLRSFMYLSSSVDSRVRKRIQQRQQQGQQPTRHR